MHVLTYIKYFDLTCEKKVSILSTQLKYKNFTFWVLESGQSEWSIKPRISMMIITAPDTDDHIWQSDPTLNITYQTQWTQQSVIRNWTEIQCRPD